MKRIVRLTESDLARIVRRVINERQYLMEGLGNTKLELVTGPVAINRTVCSTGEDQFLVNFTVKNTGAEIAYLTRVVVGGKGLGNQQQNDHKVSIDKVSKHSNHDNGVEQAIVPVGKTAIVTVIAKTRLGNWTASIQQIYNKLKIERDPTKKTELQNQLAALRKESPFGANQVYIEYNGGSLSVPLDTKGLVLGNTSCEAPIDLARGF
jgi:hypothetical protein